MDLRSSLPYWLVRNGLLQTFPPLERDARCDVLVVGGGITGALVGHHLTEAGLSTLVVDRREVGWGSTAASTALLQYEIDTPLHQLQQRVGHAHATRCYLACRDAIHQLRDLVATLDDDCGFRMKPSLYYAGRQRDLPGMKREFAARRAAGFEVQWWDQGKIRRHLPFAKAGAIWSRDGAQVDAFRLAATLLRHACARGLRVCDRTTVTSHEVRGRHLLAKTDRGPSIRARHIVFATGYEAQGDLDQKIVSLHSSFALVSEPLSGRWPAWHQDALIWEHARPYLYLRTTEDHRILIGGEDEPFQDPDKRDALIPSKTRTLLRKFRHLFPNLPLEVAFAWAGTFGETRDGLPFIGQKTGFPLAWFTLGFGGNGITYSMLAAQIVRDQVLGKKNPYGDLFGFDRPGLSR